MTQYDTLNIKFSKFSYNHNESNFLHKFPLTDTQVARLSKVFANNLSANI